MDSQTSSKPAWWLITLVTALIMSLLVLTHRLILAPGWRGLADIGIVFFSYGLVELWLRQHISALAHNQADEIKPTIIVVEPFIVAEQDSPQISAISEPPTLPDVKDVSPYR